MDSSHLCQIQAAAGGVKVRAIFSWHTIGPLVPIEHHLNVTAYLSIVANHVHPFYLLCIVLSNYCVSFLSMIQYIILGPRWIQKSTDWPIVPYTLFLLFLWGCVRFCVDCVNWIAFQGQIKSSESDFKGTKSPHLSLTPALHQMQHSAGRGLQGPAVIKEFTQDCAIWHYILQVNRTRNLKSNDSPHPEE